MIININKKDYNVTDNEFLKIPHEQYINLIIKDKVGLFERVISLLVELSKTLNIKNIIFFEQICGGFIPINCASEIENIYIINSNNDNCINIKDNILRHNVKNIVISNNIIIENYLKNSIIYSEKFENIDKQLITKFNPILLTSLNFNLLENGYTHILQLSNTELYLYIPNNLFDELNKDFYYYINGNKLEYDNLNHLCIMVKNGGPQFEKMLLDNIHNFDRWTILDTGSTDDTIDIITRVLIGKKKGDLYQEPFINFRDSRNRCLELAGTSCKFLTMLDDTYIIKGNLRGFLNEVRGDQVSTSFTLYIQSNDVIYGSNRIIKSDSGLKYIHKIHEVINDNNNMNIVIPKEVVFIDDIVFDYMETRTFDRKQLDLKWLFEEVDENSQNPRTYYYIAQTYNLLEDYEKAFYYFTKRTEFINSGFLQERVDALFESARLANFKLNRPWKECEELYNKCYNADETRPESLYFIGIHYYLEGNNQIAYNYFKRAFKIGFPQHCQYSLKPTLSFYFLPKFLSRVCYQLNDYQLGLEASELFLLHNKENTEDYNELFSWYNIYKKLTIYSGPKNPKFPNKPIICFVADGGFNSWTGSNILTKGVGGSETYIIEMARYIKQHEYFGEVIVFCNTPEEKDEDFEGVSYRHLNKYYEFVNNNYIHTCIVSRFSEYLPVTFKGFTENVYLVVHDLTPSGIVIPIDKKLKNIFCLTEWHVNYLNKIFPVFKDIIVPFYYGIDDKLFSNISDGFNKEQYKFIYSSYPNRGLLELLQMWIEISSIQPKATLHIFCDVNNEWSNQVEPEKMIKIKKLLYSYLEKNIGIYYHGWVSKIKLAEAWKTSTFWFYPCTFMETFCLTALEAAKYKTLAITNNLAALENTVGDRGIIIHDDPTTNEWQQKALFVIKQLLTTDKYDFYCKKQIENNYKWASSLSWSSQATKLLNDYILKYNIEHKGMYNWTNNVPYGSREIFLNIIDYFNKNYKTDKDIYYNNIKILEIGTYTGVSLINIVKLIHNSIGYGLDKWETYEDNELLTNKDTLEIEISFYNNVKNANMENKIFGIKDLSINKLIQFIQNNTKFDFICVNKTQVLLDYYTILVLSWSILENGGILVIEDCLYKEGENILNKQSEEINHFLKVFKKQYKILNIGYHIFLEKN
jgi:hypothetical protein